MKLTAKLTLVFLIAVMLLTSMGSYLTLQRGYDRMEAYQLRLAEQTADMVRERVEQAWRAGGIDQVGQELNSLVLQDGALRVRWVWFERHDLGGPGRQSIVTVRQGQLGNSTVANEDGQRVLKTYYPIALNGVPRGGLEVTQSLESHDTVVRETVAGTLLVLGVISITSFGIVYFAGLRWVARPLEQLIDKAQRIGNGDFSTPVHVAGNDEFNQLATALNEMSSRLAEQQQQIHKETSERLATVEQLRHADRLKTVGRLAAGVAHEIGTPLNVISGRAGLIASGKLNEHDSRESSKIIKGEADRIGNIIQQLLDFARQREPRRQRANLNDLIEQTVALLGTLAEKRHVELVYRAPDVPVYAQIDVGQLQQVLTNLIVNAVHASPEEGGRVVCDIVPATAGVRNGAACIRITDNGHGIADEDLPHIFEPFFTTKEVGEGTGLGLSIAHGIIEEHGGKIDVESTPGQGTTFTIQLGPSVQDDPMLIMD